MKAAGKLATTKRTRRSRYVDPRHPTTLIAHLLCSFLKTGQNEIGAREIAVSVQRTRREESLTTGGECRRIADGEAEKVDEHVGIINLQ